MNVKLTILAIVLAFATSALVSYVITRDGAATTSTKPTPRRTAAASGPSYAALLAELDQHNDFMQKRAEQRSDDWLTRMHLGASLLERATLTNKPADYARLQALLDDAFAIAPRGAGPVAVAARFNFSIHRLAVAEQYLDLIEGQAIPQMNDQVVAALLRAEIAGQRGQYDVALAGLTKLAEAVPAVAGPPLALHLAKTGDPARAEELLTAAFAATTPKDSQRRAWLKLQLGILAMNRGELLGALARFEAADAELSGWWLVREHIAEIHHRRSNHSEAIEILQELVRTADLPQHMDALAGLYRHTGETTKADELIAQAATRWDQLYAQFPEAALGHMLQHYLQFGPPSRALELALANHELRPGGDAKTSLALAYLQNNQPAEALATAEQALATPYRTARLHDVAAKAHTALGHTAAAEEQSALCLAINPTYSSSDHSH